VKVVKAFLGTRKKKENGKTYSFIQLQKYNDCILHGAKEANKRLPRTYYEEMEKFLILFKKETAKAKKDGNLDEQEADPISWSLLLPSYVGLVVEFKKCCCVGVFHSTMELHGLLDYYWHPWVAQFLIRQR
jgi:hypothetical protein